MSIRVDATWTDAQHRDFWLLVDDDSGQWYGQWRHTSGIGRVPLVARTLDDAKTETEAAYAAAIRT